MPAIDRGTVCCISLGCAKNLVDSERLAGVLSSAGFTLTADAARAETCIVNTCGFIKDAAEESVSVILDLIELKSKGLVRKIGVMGCLLNRYGQELVSELPEVDFWAESEDYAAVEIAMTGKDISSRPEFPKRALLANHAPHTRYLKVSEGCDNCCSYCTIPSIRGGNRSIPVDSLVREAASLIEEGAREICIVGQDVAAYGTDTRGGGGLLGLLEAIDSSVPRGVWVRLLYLQPMHVDKGLMEYVASSETVLPYLDIPIQHASDRILASMNRRATKKSLREIFSTARSIRPGFALRTTCMVGFPGESKADFGELMDFLEEVRFDRVGCFVFSPEEGTKASLITPKVTPKTAKSRLERLMTLQEDISLERQSLFVGSTLDVLVDSLGDGVAEGRSYREAPDVDGVLEIVGARPGLRVGDVIKADVIEAAEHDMLVREVGQ